MTMRTQAASVVVATRFWGALPQDYDRLERFLGRVSELALFVRIIVAINVGEDRTDSVNRLRGQDIDDRIKLLPISRWGKVTDSLNAILSYIDTDSIHCDALLLQSPEIHAKGFVVKQMIAALDAESLVVGCALDGHNTTNSKHDGYRVLGGDTCPWNTLALWSFPKLRETGFLPLVDTLSPPGLEELAVVLSQQNTHGAAERSAKLLVYPQNSDAISWDTAFRGDVERQKYHAKKMASKRERGRQIAAMLGNLRGKVQFTYT
eukprot:Plantae.Rhodophyta-Rhodochaete_pulchella.ctg3233.p2 GENE.Plantae.Rhodophyta-Rhodochaete_pulchella.ctg3233~~Plantae.Rhodophyta-Rhodochaete_pulchella.ctg3233.p2  ORF type:complete len:263 (-),score=32.31 Plantae.Rhodophyta-Rhodochaete_pulchella.ctg3233:1526-2314(-)